MKPTVGQVMDAARSLLGDDSIGGGEVFTDAVLQPHFANAYRRLYRQMLVCQNPYVLCEAFYDVPANTMVLDPATAGILNMGELQWVEERGISSSVAVSNAAVVGSTATITTADPHGRTTGDTVVIFGVEGIPFVNGMATITVTGADAFTFLCAASGTYTGGGTVSYSQEQFRRMVPVDRLETVPASTPTGPPLGKYAWMGDQFRFFPCNEVRQLRITYTTSGDAPTSPGETIGIDDSVDPLATLTAAFAARAKGFKSLSQDLLAEALGPTFAMDGEIGGLFYELLQAGVRAMQNQRTRRPPFRTPRSTGPMQHIPLL